MIVVLAAALVVLAGLFSAADAALTSFSRARAEELGAELLLDRTDDEDEPLYVLADPSGHPFCLLVR